jgi:hypothetical protein
MYSHKDLDKAGCTRSIHPLERLTKLSGDILHSFGIFLRILRE